MELLFQRVSLAVVRGNATSLLMIPTTIAAPVEGNERGILPELTLVPAYPGTDPVRSAERTCEKDASLQLDSVGWRKPGDSEESGDSRFAAGKRTRPPPQLINSKDSKAQYLCD